MKAPLKRALYSGLIFPGFGQFSNGQKAKGALFVVAALFVVFGLLGQFAYIFVDYFKAIGQLADPENMSPAMLPVKNLLYGILRLFLIWGVLGIVVWTYSTLDAYFVAKRKSEETTDKFGPG